jgi:hypothetical protein
MVFPLAKIGSDHVPCVLNVDTNIPKTTLFRFDNYWVNMPGFLECGKSSWDKGSRKNYSSTILADKLKTLRHELKKWHVSLAKLKQIIKNCNSVIFSTDSLEEQRPLYTVEFYFKKIVKDHLDCLLLAECNYWRKRCTIRWIQLGEYNTHKIHAMATERYRRNTIAMLRDVDGNEVTDHDSMVGLFWREYKERMGKYEPISKQFDLDRILHKVDGLQELTRPLRWQRWMR